MPLIVRTTDLSIFTYRRYKREGREVCNTYYLTNQNQILVSVWRKTAPLAETYG